VADAITELLAVASDQGASEKLRGLAVGAVGQIGDTRVLAWMIARTKDASRIIRYHAVDGLEHLGGADAQRALLRVLRDKEEENFIRIRAAWAASNTTSTFSGGAANQELLSILKDDSQTEFIRMHVARVLVMTKVPGGKEAALALKEKSRDSFVVSTLEKLIAGQDQNP
jgi:hypothetical protein